MDTARQVATPLELAAMPGVLHQNETLRDKAVAAMSAKVAELGAVDIKGLTVLDGDAIDNTLNDLQVRGTDAISLNKERRSPFTKEMDRVRSMFTSCENDIQAQLEKVKAWRSSWNSEKYRRDQEQKQKAQLSLDKKNAGVAFSSDISNSINQSYIAFLSDFFGKLNQAFNNTTIAAFDEYEQRLRSYMPTLEHFPFSVPHAPTILSTQEAKAIYEKTYEETFAALAADFLEKATTELYRLVASIPSRKLELLDDSRKGEAAARIKQEEDDRILALQKQRESINSATQATAEAATMTNAFEAAAQPAISLSSGTTIKKKYEPTTHKAFVAIIQSWVKNEMHLLTIEELSKKLSFMVTSANKLLNNGEKIEAEGLQIEDDLTIRSSRKKS